MRRGNKKFMVQTAGNMERRKKWENGQRVEGKAAYIVLITATYG